MPVNILSKSDCQRLIEGIRETLSAVKPQVLTHIMSHPDPFRPNDKHIFERLTWAVLSNGTGYNLLRPHFLSIERTLFYYNLSKIAGLSDQSVSALFHQQIAPLRIPSRTKIETKLCWVRDDAKVFLNIQGKHGSVWQFIQTSLSGSPLDQARGCYIMPNDNALVSCFTEGALKLKGVGLATCCEFFNTIGIDEFKPDTHTKRFLKRVGINNALKESGEAKRTREAGVEIAETLGQPRRYVDSHIWVFCAEGEGEICTENNPKCHLCKLNAEEPRLCTYCGSSTMPGAAA